ncbi:hypothetical protein BG55_10465 [Erwinia mallotivora]|uniref:Flagellar protein FliL n=2 Tax=Erwinia mallotivora TaxID=69222 RepID=A0A014PXU4_9GAMM|nr:hypothetical protein BG55_10465 [Erwinia mallotivora]
MVYLMTIKSFFLILLLVVTGAVVNAGLVVMGNHYLQRSVKSEANPPVVSTREEQHGWQYVEVKNLRVSLDDKGTGKHALSLDLALSTSDDVRAQQTENLLPEIKAFTLDIFNSLSPDEVRSMNMMELRQLMMERYQSDFDAINVLMPFTDLTLSKMVFM